MNTDYPNVDFGLGIGYSVFEFQNTGYARAGPYFAWDLNRDLSRSDWISAGAFLSREIQSNITIGGLCGYSKGWQFGMFIGLDVWPWAMK